MLYKKYNQANYNNNDQYKCHNTTSNNCNDITAIIILVLLGGDVAITSLPELVIKFTPTVELTLAVNPMLFVELMPVIKLILVVGSEVIISDASIELVLAAGSEDIT